METIKEAKSHLLKWEQPRNTGNELQNVAMAMMSPGVAMGVQRRKSVSAATRIQKDFMERVNY